jgi:methylthioribose-1-phosphate isomerase
VFGPHSKGESRDEVLRKLESAYLRLRSTRPTAINLFLALETTLKVARSSKNPSKAVIEAAQRIFEDDVTMNKQLEKIGSTLLKEGDVIMTHCNAGSLATSGYGTALGVIKEAFRQGKNISVYADETRPLLQGARLTACELVDEGIPITVITDSMAAFVMKNQGVTMVMVGADRIALNGDVANKIGTYQLSILAKEHNIPFYVAAPSTTIDLEAVTGSDVKIEFRAKEEIEFFNGKRIVPKRAEILNPAFDITPAKYITGIITEKGIFKPSQIKSIPMNRR